MKSELDALIAKYEKLRLDASSGKKNIFCDNETVALACTWILVDLKGLRKECDKNESGNGVYC